MTQTDQRLTGNTQDKPLGLDRLGLYVHGGGGTQVREISGDADTGEKNQSMQS